MRRIGYLASIASIAILCMGVYVYAAGEFTLDCVLCDVSDSGTATGDGVSGVGTSDGTSDFGGPVPTFATIGVRHPKDLRFTLTINVPSTSETCTPTANDLQQNFTSCSFAYSAINVDQLTFFVSTDSTYCQQSPSPCQTIASVKLGESFSGELSQIVIFSAPLVGESGIQLDLGEETVLQLTNKQWQELFQRMKAVTDYDPAAQFILGFATKASAVDGDPTDANRVKLAPFNRILSVATFSRK